MKLHRPIAWLVLATAAVAAGAAPFAPVDDTQVVESLPKRLGGSAAQQRALRAQLQHAPKDLNLAVRAARDAIERARMEGDPRELGSAQAALAPWWNDATPPAAVRLLRATLRQSAHDFTAALSDLDALIDDRSSPLTLQAQAEITRAGVWQVLGRWADADAGCERLGGKRYAALGTAVRWSAQVCRAELLSLRGQVDAAESALAELSREAAPGVAAWIALIRAELAERRGDARAEAHYRTALQARADVYTLAAYADWLLTARRARDALALLDGREAADALLLRQAIAYRQLGDARATAATATLRERFAASRVRGDSLHRREEALLALYLEGDAVTALALARAQWAEQKEPADALLLVQAARAAGQDAAAEPVTRLMRETGYTDARLDVSSRQLAARQP
jgi:hypothetical protein